MSDLDQRNHDFSKAMTDVQFAYIEAERRVVKLKAENEKLREELAQYGLFREVVGDPAVEFASLRRELHRVEHENAKLRELVKAFNWCTENFDLQCKCDSCPLGQSDKLTPECEVRMRELGIEAGE